MGSGASKLGNTGYVISSVLRSMLTVFQLPNIDWTWIVCVKHRFESTVVTAREVSWKESYLIVSY